MINHEEFLNSYDRCYSRNVSPTEKFKRLAYTYFYGIDEGLSTGLPEIRKVIFHDPATIIIWSDGSKSIVKCTKKDKYDPEKGFAMAIAKKALGNKGNYYNVFRECVPVSEDEVDLYYLDNIEL